MPSSPGLPQPASRRWQPVGHAPQPGGGWGWGYACYLVLCVTTELNYNPITSSGPATLLPVYFILFLTVVVSQFICVKPLHCIFFFFPNTFFDFCAEQGRTAVWMVYNTANQSQLTLPPSPAVSPNPNLLCTKCYSEAPWGPAQDLPLDIFELVYTASIDPSALVSGLRLNNTFLWHEWLCIWSFFFLHCCICCAGICKMMYCLWMSVIPGILWS